MVEVIFVLFNRVIFRQVVSGILRTPDQDGLKVETIIALINKGHSRSRGATTFSITTCSITTFSITTFSITAFSIMTLSMKGLFVTPSTNGIQHN
jgi:hypothetical protein